MKPKEKKPRKKNNNLEIYSEKEYKEMRRRVKEMEKDKTGAYLKYPKYFSKS
jgi:hypothetical protein